MAKTRSLHSSSSHPQGYANTFGVAFLRQLLQRRLEKNPRYSLRAFSKSVGVSHSLLSQILSNQRPLTAQTAQRISERLNLPPQQQVLLKRKTESSSRSVLNEEWTEMDLEQYALIAEWQHFAILSLLETKDFKMSPESVSKRLNISPLLAKVSIERLKRLNYIGQDEKGTWRQIVPPFKIENKVSTIATKKCHLQMLRKAAESLREDPIEYRDHSGTVFAVDPQHVSYAVQRIREFRRQLCTELESFGTPKEVYALTVQFFPLSKRGQK